MIQIEQTVRSEMYAMMAHDAKYYPAKGPSTRPPNSWVNMFTENELKQVRKK